jgi:hypothetical protein
LISHGIVKFCDADATRCSGLAIFGVAQLDARGLASIVLTLGPGSHHFKALFCGTPHSDPPSIASSSTIQAITVKAAANGARSGGPS